MTLPQYLHLYSYHLCAQDLTLTLKSVIQLGRLCSMANARMKRMNSLDVSRQNKILNILKARKMIWWEAGTQKHTYGYGESTSRRVESRLTGKSRETTKVEEYHKYYKKNEVSRQNKVLNILNIWTGKMILWHACGQELNLLSEKRNFKKPQNLCLKRWYLYSILRNGQVPGYWGKYRAISEKRWKE